MAPSKRWDYPLPCVELRKLRGESHETARGYCVASLGPAFRSTPAMRPKPLRTMGHVSEISVQPKPTKVGSEIAFQMSAT